MCFNLTPGPAPAWFRLPIAWSYVVQRVFQRTNIRELGDLSAAPQFVGSRHFHRTKSHAIAPRLLRRANGGARKCPGAPRRKLVTTTDFRRVE
jgi:hypothetical protein